MQKNTQLFAREGFLTAFKEREGFLRNPHSLPTASCATKTKNLLAQVNLDRQVFILFVEREGLLRNPHSLPTASCATKTKNLLA